MGNCRLAYQILAFAVCGLFALGCADNEESGTMYGYPDPPEAHVRLSEDTDTVDKNKVTVGTLVELDGSKSSDPKDLSLTYHWSFLELPAGSTAELNQDSLRKPSFIADLEGTYVVALTVDNSYWRSDQVELEIHAVACQPAVAEIIADPAEPIEGDAVQVSATINEDCGEQQPYEYQWMFTSIPIGSAAKLNDSRVIAPSFVADVPGDFVLTLVVTDALGRRSALSTLTLTVQPVGECGNAAPVAKAELLWTDSGIDLASLKVGVPATVQLTGRASTDADNGSPCSLNQQLFYGWRFVALPGGSKATLNDNQIVNPSFIADRAGEYVVALTVMDSIGLVSEETILTIKAGS